MSGKTPSSLWPEATPCSFRPESGWFALPQRCWNRGETLGRATVCGATGAAGDAAGVEGAGLGAIVVLGAVLTLGGPTLGTIDALGSALLGIIVALEAEDGATVVDIADRFWQELHPGAGEPYETGAP